MKLIEICVDSDNNSSNQKRENRDYEVKFDTPDDDNITEQRAETKAKKQKQHKHTHNGENENHKQWEYNGKKMDLTPKDIKLLNTLGYYSLASILAFPFFVYGGHRLFKYRNTFRSKFMHVLGSGVFGCFGSWLVVQAGTL